MHRISFYAIIKEIDLIHVFYYNIRKRVPGCDNNNNTTKMY